MVANSLFSPANANGNLGAANAFVAIGATRGNTLTAHVLGTFTGTLSLQGSLDGVNFVTLNQALTWLNQATGAYQTSITAPGIYQASVTGIPYLRVAMTSYTSGTATVLLQESDGVGLLALDAPLPAGSNILGSAKALSQAGADGVTPANIDEMAIGAYNGTNVDRLVNVTGATSASGSKALFVGTGMLANTNISAAAAPVAGASVNGYGARPSHTIQVDVTTTTVGTAGAHTVQLQGSLDNVNWTTLATVSPASTSLTASDPSNHANASVTGQPYRYIRANWTAIPTGWVGTLNALVVSA